MPGARCTHSLVCAQVVKYAHEYSQRRHRKSPGIPARGNHIFLNTGSEIFFTEGLDRNSRDAGDLPVEAEQEFVCPRAR
jgi:hypothetical protein